MFKIVFLEDGSAKEFIASMRNRANDENIEVTKVAESILRDVRSRGLEAVQEYSKKFDNSEAYEVPISVAQDALERIDPSLRAAINRAAKNILDYQSRTVPKSSQWMSPEGGLVGQLVIPLSKVGIYVPGGTASYPSTVLMTAIPAKVAGVPEIIMVTPPTEQLNDAVLAAAAVAGVDRIFAVGGVQAVAALSYGAGFIPKVDKIVGPGNAYVAAAKRLSFGNIDIDMIAGPSEILVIADDSANARLLAADLLSQAEHDRLSSSILVTTSENLANKVVSELIDQCDKLPRKEIVKYALENYGGAIICDTPAQMCDIANEIAPEHLQIVTKYNRVILSKIKNAGAVFLGESSPEPLGDYMAGPSHVLPTSGTARFFSPLSSDSFVRQMSIIDFDKLSFGNVAQDIAVLAHAEGLDAHARAAELRIEHAF